MTDNFLSLIHIDLSTRNQIYVRYKRSSFKIILHFQVTFISLLKALLWAHQIRILFLKCFLDIRKMSSSNIYSYLNPMLFFCIRDM